ncbi:hypothetical protein HPB47_013536 [Ixodes persulcatus]|uniref:Uncharacterized protein n=1 Tax=Ixodes persulcatus TaxID=34615 RepID=A0AC60R1P6_IXOPE|nr:hypothetical protein HPB47_013536 [Ixodes persulcatus]
MMDTQRHGVDRIQALSLHQVHGHTFLLQATAPTSVPEECPYWKDIVGSRGSRDLLLDASSLAHLDVIFPPEFGVEEIRLLTQLLKRHAATFLPPHISFGSPPVCTCPVDAARAYFFWKSVPQHKAPVSSLAHLWNSVVEAAADASG